MPTLTITEENLTLTIGTGTDALTLQGRAVSSTAPTDGQVLGYDATAAQWEPTTDLIRLLLTAPRVRWVGLDEDLQDAVDAATAGDTLVLGSGTYTLTENLVINKALNIQGQGRNQTVIACATDTVYIAVTASNVRIADVTFDWTQGDVTSRLLAIGVSVEVSGFWVGRCNFNTVGTGAAGAIYIANASGVIMDCVVNGTSGSGSLFRVTSAAGQTVPMQVDIYNTHVLGTGTGASVTGLNATDSGGTLPMVCNVWDGSFTCTNASGESYGAQTSGADAVLTLNSTLLGGSTADIKQSASATCNARGCILLNGLATGTVARSGRFCANDLYLGGDSLTIATAKTPASAGAAGVTGQIAWDANYIYVCIATNTWRRIQHATWP